MSKAYVNGLLDTFIKREFLTKDDSTLLINHLEKTGKIKDINPMHKNAWVGAALAAARMALPWLGRGIMAGGRAIGQAAMKAPGVVSNIAKQVPSVATNFATQTVPNAARSFVNHPLEATKNIGKTMWHNPIGQGAAWAGGYEGISRALTKQNPLDDIEKFSRVKEVLTKQAGPLGLTVKGIGNFGLNLVGATAAEQALGKIGKSKAKTNNIQKAVL